MKPRRLLAAAALAMGLLSGHAGAQPAIPAAPDNKSQVFWERRVVLDDIFPSMIVANAARKSASKPPANYRGDPYGSVGIVIRTTEPDSKVVVSIKLGSLAEPGNAKYDLPTPGEYRIYPHVHWDFEKLSSMVQPMPVTFTVAVTLNGQSLGQRSGAVRVRSINDVPYAVKNSKGEQNLWWMFAAYVNEEHPWIDVLLQDALRTGIVKNFVGYQGTEQDVQRQVAAIYAALHKRGIVYSSITTNSAASERVLSQHVRFVSESVKYTQANCIDGVVLMASILRKIGLDPLIIIGPGHAMLGYYNGPNHSRGVTVVETTAIGTQPFSIAVKAGAAKFNEWITKYRDDPRVAVVDVAKWRRQGVMPIPR
jgi:hypothetical protein